MMKIIINILILILGLSSFVFSNTNEKSVYSGDDAISLSPKKASKRINIIKKTFATEDEHVIKKRSHKRRRKVRRPRQGR